MAIITDYDTLSTAVGNYLDRAELTSFVPNFIEAVENKLYRSLEIRGLEATTSIAFSGPTLAVSGVSNYRNPKFWYLDTAPVSVLEFVTAEQLFREYPTRSQTTTRPKLIARVGTVFEFGPTLSSDSYTLKGIHYTIPVNLSSGGTTTNWFTDNMPELLLYGALVEAEPFILGDSRIPVWRALYEDGLKALREMERRENRGGGTMAIKVA